MAPLTHGGIAPRLDQRRPLGPRRRASLTQIALVILVIVALPMAPFIREIPLHESWRDLLVAEFKKRGIEIAVRSVALSPFEGVVARGVLVFEGAQRRRKVAEAERLGLAVDWHKLLTKRHFLDLIDLRGGRIQVGGDSEEGFATELSDLHVRLHLAERQLRVSDFRARLGGIDVTASGTLLNHGDFRLPDRESAAAQGQPQNGKGQESYFSTLPELLRRLRAGNASRVDLQFSGDLAQPKTVEVSGRSLIEGLSLGNYKATRLRAEFKWSGDGRLELRKVELADRLGSLACTGFVHLASGAIGLQIESGVDLAGLASAIANAKGARPGSTQGHAATPLNALLADVRFRGEQRVSASISRAGDKFQMTGRFWFGQVNLRHLNFSAGGTFSTDGKRVMIRKLGIEAGPGQLSGDILFGGGQTKIALKSSLDPAILKPFLTGRARAALDEWQFRDPPEVSFEATASGFDLTTLVGAGNVRLGRTVYRGVSIREATSDISYARGAFTYSKLWVERPEGFLSGKMIYDFLGSEVRFEEVISTVDPQECCVWIDPRIRQDLRMFRFRAPPTMSIEGHAQFGGKTDVDLRMQVHAPKGFEYEVIGKWLPVDSARAALQFTFGRLDIRNLDARTLGGQLRGNLFVSLRPDERSYGADLDLENIDFEKFTKLYFNYQGSQGAMRARYRFQAQMDKLATMNGEGSVLVTRGNVFAIPVFGPLSGILNAIIPGIGFSPARRASASFDVRQGVAETRDMEVQGTGFTMLGEGILDFVRDRMDFNVRINARGVPGMIFFPVSKLFEFTSTSALSNPQWRPKRFSVAPREERSLERSGN